VCIAVCSEGAEKLRPRDEWCPLYGNRAMIQPRIAVIRSSSIRMLAEFLEASKSKLTPISVAWPTCEEIANLIWITTVQLVGNAGYHNDAKDADRLPQTYVDNSYPGVLCTR
jgi:hypothetical protein